MSDQQRRSEQAPAGTEVTEVVDGILRLELPVALPGLGHVNCYALEDHRGLTVVDPGLADQTSIDALGDRLGALGAGPARVHTVVVTHSHPDHYGGAGWLRRVGGARIVTHEAFRNWWDAGDDAALIDPPDPAAEADRGATTVNDLGAPAPEGRGPGADAAEGIDGDRMRARIADKLRADADIDADASDPGAALGLTGAPRPTDRVADDGAVEMGGRRWVAVHTPGHTPDHLCLLDPDNGVLLSGDHVLPSITPHISGINAGPDPLSGFLASLERVAGLAPVQQVLPAHGRQFRDLAGRAEAIRNHHLERLETLVTAVERIGPATVEELSRELFSRRAWGPLAESETFAHLEHLRRRHRVTRDETAGVLAYRSEKSP